MRTREPTSTNIFEPPMRQAFSLTGSVSSRLRLPSFSRSNTMRTVISLLIEAGGNARSGFLAYSSCPDCRSIRIAACAGVSKAWVRGARPADQQHGQQAQHDRT